MKIKRLLIASLAALGIGSGHAASVPSQSNPTEQRQQVAVKNGTTNREIKEDHFGGYAGGILAALKRNDGTPPHVWGVSRACARMVRKNRMHRAGVGHARI